MKKLVPYVTRKDARGRLVGLLNEGTWEEFNYLETRAGETRGNHYHLKTTEIFFIISGEIDVKITNSNGISSNEHLSAGDILRVDPNEIHTFFCVTDAAWINVLSNRFNQENPDMHTSFNEKVERN